MNPQDLEEAVKEAIDHFVATGGSVSFGSWGKLSVIDGTFKLEGCRGCALTILLSGKPADPEEASTLALYGPFDVCLSALPLTTRQIQAFTMGFDGRSSSSYSFTDEAKEYYNVGAAVRIWCLDKHSSACR